MRLTYVFREGRKTREINSQFKPTDFFYGAHQMGELGFEVELLEDADIGMAPPLPAYAKLVNRVFAVAGDLPVGMFLASLISGKYKNLEKTDIVIATTNGIGLALAMGRWLGFVRRPVLLLAMGLMPNKKSALSLFIYERLLRQLHVVSISRGEQDHLQKRLKGQHIDYIPFGVDLDFWTPGGITEDYVLAIGNDRNRDWGTLVKAWREDMPLLKIVTSLPVVTNLKNIEVIRGDWRKSILTDEEIRELYQRSRFVVIPLKQTYQPAGQSACLQAMACGKAVILSDIYGMWDRELMRNGVTVSLVVQQNHAELTTCIRNLLLKPADSRRLGAAAREMIEKNLNVNATALALADLLPGFVEGKKQNQRY